MPSLSPNLIMQKLAFGSLYRGGLPHLKQKMYQSFSVQNVHFFIKKKNYAFLSCQGSNLPPPLAYCEAKNAKHARNRKKLTSLYHECYLLTTHCHSHKISIFSLSHCQCYHLINKRMELTQRGVQRIVVQNKNIDRCTELHRQNLNSFSFIYTQSATSFLERAPISTK